MLNRLRKTIAEKGNALGSFMGVATPTVLETISTSGLDFIVIDCEHGPFDLSICMGIPGKFDDPEFTAAMDRILKACKTAGKLCMTFTMSPEEAKVYFAEGYDAVACGLDSGIIADAYKAMVKSVRE